MFTPLHHFDWTATSVNLSGNFVSDKLHLLMRVFCIICILRYFVEVLSLLPCSVYQDLGQCCS